MDDKYTFERFDNELDNGFQIYFTYVNNRTTYGNDNT